MNVDVATYKAEFLAHYYRDHRRHLRDYAFGFMDKWAHLASAIPALTPRLANLPLQLPGLSHALKAVLKVAPQRRLPQSQRAASRASNAGHPTTGKSQSYSGPTPGTTTITRKLWLPHKPSSEPPDWT